MNYKHKNIDIKIPKYDSDVNIELPDGNVVVLQFRSSNADIDTRGSFDIILPQTQSIIAYRSQSLDKPSYVKRVQQITTELPFVGE